MTVCFTSWSTPRFASAFPTCCTTADQTRGRGALSGMDHRNVLGMVSAVFKVPLLYVVGNVPVIWNLRWTRPRGIHKSQKIGITCSFMGCGGGDEEECVLLLHVVSENRKWRCLSSEMAPKRRMCTCMFRPLIDPNKTFNAKVIICAWSSFHCVISSFG